MNNFTVNMDEYLPLRDVVFKAIRQAILRGELKPGERLMEIALAEKLGVSRTPIREAMRKLEREGLVVMIPRRGAQVANITEKDLNDVLEVRMALENMAIEKACRLITEEQTQALYEAMQTFEETMKEGDLTKLAQADVDFHEIIYEASDNKRLIQLLNELREQIYRYRIEYLKDEETRNTLAKEHIVIYEAIRVRDVKKAQLSGHTHVENQRQAIMKSIEQSTRRNKKNEENE
ncbi:MAG: GntR family transcriptional regulator [Lachnospiraceae bacterium]